MFETYWLKRHRWGLTILLGGLFAITALAALLKAWPILYPSLIETGSWDPTCQLTQGPCTLSLDTERSVALEIRPQPIAAAVPLQLTVNTKGIKTEGVEVDFVGVDMHMGFNRFALRRVDDNRYQGEGLLPVCVSARMEWEARVLVDTPQGRLSAPFRFAIDRD